MTTTLTPTRKTELLIGAIELALLDRIRQEYVDNSAISTLFVVDFPYMAHVHCTPPLNLSLVETTGFLTAPERLHRNDNAGRVPEHADYSLMRVLAKTHPLALGLTEVLARFVFDKSWSGNIPKLMLSTQTDEAAALEAGILNGALAEWAEAPGRTEGMHTALEKISRKHRDSVKEFVSAVITQAEDSLPALYGEYSRTRQHLRFSDVKPLPTDDVEGRPVMFAHAINELRGYFDEVDEGGIGHSKFLGLTDTWAKALLTVLPEDEPTRAARRLADAQTLALIEYLNTRLLEDKFNFRVAYLTSHNALYNVAAVRFGHMRRNEIAAPRKLYGSKQAFNRTRYNASLLGESNLLSLAPILDPRALMSDRRFVEYAVAGTDQKLNLEKGQAITEWLPLFFNGLERDPQWLADSYLSLQGARNPRARSAISEQSFDDRQYNALIDSWERYIRTIGAGYGLARYNTSASLRSLLVSIVDGHPGAVTTEIKRRLEETLTVWLPAVAGATFAQMGDAENKTPHQIVRSVPPLIMPAFDKIQRSLLTLLGNTAPLSTRAGNGLAWLTKPTAQNLGLPESWVDAAKWRVNYIHSLGLAYGFAAEENWAGAFRLAELTYSMARTNAPNRGDQSDERLITGREAAFLCSFAARRRLAINPLAMTSLPLENRLLVELEHAFGAEQQIFDGDAWASKKRAHQLRIEGERLAWRVFRLLCSYAARSTHSAAGRSLFVDIGDIERLHYNLVENATAALAVCAQFEKSIQSTSCDNLTYFAAMFYLARQSSLNILQLRLFAGDDEGEPTAAPFLQKALDVLGQLTPERSASVGVSMPWAKFEQHLIFAAYHYSGVTLDWIVDLRGTQSSADRVSANSNPEKSDSPSRETLVSWRDKKLQQILGPY